MKLNGSRLRSGGIALVTALVLLVILTIVALSAMRTTTLEYRMSGNSAHVTLARQISESGRMAVSSVLHEHVFERSWSGVALTSGLAIGDKDGNGEGDSLITNEGGESFDASDLLGSLATDAIYTDPISAHQSSISVYDAATKLAPGSGAAMSAGYMGLGKGAAGGGSNVYFFVLSEGTGEGSSRFVTSADVLVPIGH